MSNKRNYRRVSVKKISLEQLKESCIKLGGCGTSVGLDIGKEEIVAVIRWSDGSFDCPWSVKNPCEIKELIELLQVVKESCDNVSIGMESTGTYGEAVRIAMTAGKLDVQRISGKSTSDYKEIFDGVPSQHDGKDAAIIAELTAFGKGTAWPFELPSEQTQEIEHQVQRLDAFRKIALQWTGRLEALVAKHWPELTRELSLTSATVMKLLKHYGSPQSLLADPQAAENLRSWGRPGLSESGVKGLLNSAQTTQGVPLGEAQRQWIQEVASELLKCLQEIGLCEGRLEAILVGDPTMAELLSILSSTTLSVLLATIGDPADYTSSEAFLKALGLNLKEHSSGQRQGQLSITKRGPGLARKYLYFWALRAVQQPKLRSWYESYQKVGKSRGRGTEYRKMKGLVALMRKLCRSLWYTHKHGLEFDYEKVFPGRPLDKPRGRRRRRRPATSA
jgi:transposase